MGGTPGGPGCLRTRARGKRPLATPRLVSGRPERCGQRKGRAAATLPCRAAPRRPARPRALAPARADTYADAKVKGGLPGRAARRGAGTRQWEEDRAGAAVLGFSCPQRLLTLQPLPSPSLSAQGTLVTPAQCMCVRAPVFTRTRGCARYPLLRTVTHVPSWKSAGPGRLVSLVVHTHLFACFSFLFFFFLGTS